jgi:DNA oxidative demethylase
MNGQDIHYDPLFVASEERDEILSWLSTIHPIWEQRYSKSNPPPPGQEQRWLLRPVYWLGNWQFACLNYYHPPGGVENRCVRAEPFPPVLKKLVERSEKIARRLYHGADMPKDWHLNTCLVNMYGSRIENGKRVDTARVGEHKDFEPGPVVSISLGERALFQFVSSTKVGERDGVVFQQWLEDRSLQIFGGDKWKNRLFHRVQRVDRRDEFYFPMHVEKFKSRRINFTFRFVPEEHILQYKDLPKEKAEDILPYMKELAKHSSFFTEALQARS